LAIHTATAVCSVALTLGEEVAGEVLLSCRKQHSEHLLRLIDGLSAQTGIALQSIDLIAVTVGPGSFTGLRVGISTAQGLAMALRRNLVGLSTLEVLAAQVCSPGKAVCPMIDARRDQVYTCLFRCTANGALQAVMPEAVVSPQQWLAALPDDTLFIGDGACAYREQIERAQGTGVVAPGVLALPRAATVAALARQRYASGGQDACGLLVPRYVRPPDAELSAHVKKGSFNPLGQ